MSETGLETSRPLRTFLAGMTRLVDSAGGEEALLLRDGRVLLERLVSDDKWLPDFCAQPGAALYQQYLLYCDPLERFSVVSFVWGPGQGTPIHNHTVWGLVGILRGAETERRYTRVDGALRRDEVSRLTPGMVAHVSPNDHDIHQVANALEDRVSISIHVYGGNIGRIRRCMFDEATGAEKTFISGYCNTVLPNVWM
jgi:predicted metal-dependent enzyme (double-stranded beta helix superfamily)